MPKYGKHTDFTGFVISTEDAQFGVMHVSPIGDDMECDFCMRRATYIIDDLPGSPVLGNCAVGICQPCATDSANALDNPDEWKRPSEMPLKRTAQRGTGLRMV